MSSAAGSLAGTTARPPLLSVGRMFVNAPFDYLVIGGGLSLLTVAALLGTGRVTQVDVLTISVLVLLSNSAHFAASTLRLYTKPDAFRTWPFLTMVLPLAAVAVLTLGVIWPEQLGWHLYALYLTWSPFHYAAQAFGLATMYHYRSGGQLDPLERRLVYATAMLPFLYAFVDQAASTRVGLGWFLPREVLLANPMLGSAIDALADALAMLTFAAPVALAVRLAIHGRKGMPLISWLIVFTNGIWWVTFTYLQAFLWATVFHGLQYLAIVMLFHARERAAMPGNRWSPLAHAAGFYAACLGMGFLIFHVWPYAYVMAGFGLVESILMCTAVINIHHFVVDRYIWRLRRDAANQAVVSRG